MKEIRLANLNEVDQIMDLIDSYWEKNHLFARDKNFFMYTHQDNLAINYVISLDDNKITGILGFIKYSNEDIATILWCVKKGTSPVLGVELLQFMKGMSVFMFSLGIKQKTIGVYNYLDIYTNYLEQFIIVNHTIKNYKILEIESRPVLHDFIRHEGYLLKEITNSDFDFNFDSDYLPHKNRAYFIKRYFNHPIYHYTIFGIYKNSVLTSLIVTREVVFGSSKILRIMDYLGDEKDLVFISNHLYNIIVEHSYEYIDFMCFGFDYSILQLAGFTKIDLESKKIIAPNYFSPFIKKNIKLNFMADTKEINKLRICKADSDQDRPS